MKIVTFESSAGEAPRVGALLEGGLVLDFCAQAADVPAASAHLDWFDADSASHVAARALHARVQGDAAELERMRTAGAVLQRESVSLHAPVPRPGKFICIGLNYLDHAKESGMEPPEVPLVFSKFSSSVVGPDESVVLPPGANDNDFEAELGVVVGRTARRVSEEHAMEHVLGYVCVNDVSARDFQFADGQWQRGKSPDTFAPMGEYVVTTDELVDPHVLRIQFRLNGETLQDSNTDQLIHRVPALISYLSNFTTLEPGDVIATGTPPGVGFARKPPIWIKAGDTMEVDIEGLGVLRNPVVAT